MRYLLDTHALLWARATPGLLSEEARAVFESSDTTLYVSMATLWECAIKRSIGKLELPDNFYEIVADDYEILGIELSHLVAYAELPMHHRDPFDRLLVAQARLGDLTLLTRDPNIAKYDVSVMTA
ncbi:MAG: type II toxin-antitoxin system VapC family toxin [Gammaproteobacteria bacterium]|nr:type II toxin-antitoxin system VapC family toxin [Gammaproteobacteria bacterium]